MDKNTEKRLIELINSAKDCGFNNASLITLLDATAKSLLAAVNILPGVVN